MIKKMSTERRIEFARLISSLILKAYNDHNICVAIYWFHRTGEQQQALYAIGRTVELDRKPITNCDGITIKSKHQDWEAADLCIVDSITKEWKWSRVPAYETLGEIAKELGLTWGGSWVDFPDCFHFELARTE